MYCFRSAQISYVSSSHLQNLENWNKKYTPKEEFVHFYGQWGESIKLIQQCGDNNDDKMNK
jgi:hypothetical protein